MENIEIKGMSRGAFLVRGALATSAAYGAASVTPWVTGALAQDGGGDVDILNFALTLEYLEADFYKQAAKLSLKGDYKTFAKDFGANEQAHVDAIKATIKKLGGKPVAAKSKYAFPVEKLKSQADVLRFAAGLEQGAVSAYLGAVPLFGNRDLSKAAASILGDEAMHWAVLRQALGEAPVPRAFVS